MPNHFHLVVETPTPTLGLGMRQLGSRYAQLFNERHQTGGGHLFQARFGSRLVRTDDQFAQLLRYVARNPVRAGLTDAPAIWPWSSHGAMLKRDSHPLIDVGRVSELLAPFGGDPPARYGLLFESDGPIAHIEPDLSPWKLRPTLAEIFSRHEVPAAARAARRHGYRLTDIAEHAGVSVSTVSLWMKSEA